MHPWHHALSSAKKYGGKPEDYIAIHNWFDFSKSHFADFRHRALRHHTEGIFAAEHEFGVTMTNSDNKAVPVRFIGEQHVKEDLGRIPTMADWFRCIKPEVWMSPSFHKEKEECLNLTSTNTTCTTTQILDSAFPDPEKVSTACIAGPEESGTEKQKDSGPET